jgi:5-carboxymethyl-2-hydroxymuconic-semialdehyde dehydrogenase
VRAISLHRQHRHRQPHRAGAGLKKFSMELGGKSPFVIFDDADPARALDAAVFMIFSNNGERCTAGSRILVQRSIYADFVAASPSAREASPSATRWTRRRSSAR